MSTSAVQRTRVLRGPATAQIRGIPMDTDLTLLRPILPVAQTQADADAAVAALREQAARVGYEDGYEAGRARAVEEGREELRELADRVEIAVRALDAAAADLAGRQAAAIADAEQHILTTSLQIAEAVLRRELRACDAPAREAVLRALQLAPERGDVVARLHPDDLSTIGDVTNLAADRDVTIVADPAVEAGGCILDVGPCRIDAQITPALRRVAEVLQG